MILWNVRIPLKKKLILFALFAAILVIVVVSIVRVVVVHSRKENVDISWLYLWSNVEMTTGKFSLIALSLYCANKGDEPSRSLAWHRSVSCSYTRTLRMNRDQQKQTAWVLVLGPRKRCFLTSHRHQNVRGRMRD